MTNCIKMPMNEFAAAKNLKVLITSYQLVKGGFFTSNYVAYKIVSKPFGYEVERRYSDFFWLRSILTREYPGIYVSRVSWFRFHRCLRNQGLGTLKESF